MRFTDSITIHRPLNEVFAVWSDIERYPEWAEPVIERTKLTEGPVRVGTRFHAIDQWPGRRAEFEMEVTEFEKDKRLGARWFKPMEGSWSSSLKETAEGTQLTFQIEMHMPPVMRIFSPFLKPWAKKQNRGVHGQSEAAPGRGTITILSFHSRGPDRWLSVSNRFLRERDVMRTIHDHQTDNLLVKDHT